MTSITAIIKWLDQRRDWCMSILRIYLGIGLMLKAISFIALRDEFVQLMVDNDVLWAGAGLAHVIIMTHLLGGLLMTIGFGTRVGALIQIPNLLGAVFFVHLSGGVFGFGEELRFSALVLLLLLLFVWHGSGPLSLKAMYESKSSA